MMITTQKEFTWALERLRLRDSESLAAFIMSLAHDSGPVGEQVRTFIVGDDVVETVESLEERIGSLRTPTESDYRQRRGEEIGEHLEYILDSVETLVLPADPKRAFELLVRVFKADEVAMENCGDHDYEVSSAFERAVGLIGEAAKSVSRAEVTAALEPLLDDDGYGVRGALAEIISGRADAR
jgi:hypothetical protein